MASLTEIFLLLLLLLLVHPPIHPSPSHHLPRKRAQGEEKEGNLGKFTLPYPHTLTHITAYLLHSLVLCTPTCLGTHTYQKQRANHIFSFQFSLLSPLLSQLKEFPISNTVQISQRQLHSLNIPNPRNSPPKRKISTIPTNSSPSPSFVLPVWLNLHYIQFCSNDTGVILSKHTQPYQPHQKKLQSRTSVYRHYLNERHASGNAIHFHKIIFYLLTCDKEGPRGVLNVLSVSRLLSAQCSHTLTRSRFTIWWPWSTRAGTRLKPWSSVKGLSGFSQRIYYSSVPTS